MTGDERLETEIPQPEQFRDGHLQVFEDKVRVTFRDESGEYHILEFGRAEFKEMKHTFAKADDMGGYHEFFVQEGVDDAE